MHFESFLTTTVAFSPLSNKNSVDDSRLYAIAEFDLLGLQFLVI